eukprot:CAMPEP_0202107626 /NCGR_PEP_ID=MMETSP0965-20130614/17251_1 /ASSEMBLY_ACC=CAM_ASM_000507 /TAXON_ID=4773 /ORGANISM="Schizochytrium aggregatum, Strain ATCC28209" /LENGTH=531 /DNA_ID=CAMNT_0048676803 /DNA_START=212 /DNA_END=1806 /DNA_ORIENTATION=-
MSSLDQARSSLLQQLCITADKLIVRPTTDKRFAFGHPLNASGFRAGALRYTYPRCEEPSKEIVRRIASAAKVVPFLRAEFCACVTGKGARSELTATFRGPRAKEQPIEDEHNSCKHNESREGESITGHTARGLGEVKPVFVYPAQPQVEPFDGAIRQVRFGKNGGLYERVRRGLLQGNLLAQTRVIPWHVLDDTLALLRGKGHRIHAAELGVLLERAARAEPEATECRNRFRALVASWVAQERPDSGQRVCRLLPVCSPAAVAAFGAAIVDPNDRARDAVKVIAMRPQASGARELLARKDMAQVDVVWHRALCVAATKGQASRPERGDERALQVRSGARLVVADSATRAEAHAADMRHLPVFVGVASNVLVVGRICGEHRELVLCLAPLSEQVEVPVRAKDGVGIDLHAEIFILEQLGLAAAGINRSRSVRGAQAQDTDAVELNAAARVLEDHVGALRARNALERAPPQLADRLDAVHVRVVVLLHHADANALWVRRVVKGAHDGGWQARLAQRRDEHQDGGAVALPTCVV